MNKEQLIEKLNELPEGTEIRIGTFCDEILYCEYKQVRINGKLIKCLQISRDDENY